MKKSGIMLRTLLVVGLTVILIALSVGSPTFSWFARPGVDSGGSLKYDIAATDDVYAYAGNGVSVYKTEYSTDNITYTQGNVLTTHSSMAPGTRDYYITTLKNIGSADQNVSLYITNLQKTSSSGELCVGVNSPIKQYKNMMLSANDPTNTVTKTSYTENTEMVRVYFNPKNAWSNNGWGPSDHTYKCNAGNYGSGTNFTMAYAGEDPNGGSVYYADIYQNSTFMHFYVDGETANWASTMTVNPNLSSKQSKIFYAVDEGGGYKPYIEDNNDRSKDRLWIDSTTVDGPYFNNIYSGATLNRGTAANMSLASGTDYKGSYITYESMNPSVFTVNSAGIVTALRVGNGYIKMKIHGAAYGDTKEVTTSVSVMSSTATSTISDAPIITNLKVPAGQSVEVYWFIMNDKDASGNLSYSLSNVYIGL